MVPFPRERWVPAWALPEEERCCVSTAAGYFRKVDSTANIKTHAVVGLSSRGGMRVTRQNVKSFIVLTNSANYKASPCVKGHKWHPEYQTPKGPLIWFCAAEKSTDMRLSEHWTRKRE